MRFAYIIALLSLLLSMNVSGQGRKYNFLIGYNVLTDQYTSAPKGKLFIDNLNVNVSGETRKMPFIASQANISDENGNLLMYTNGCWIADATGDTMQNGSGLNPGPFTNSWCDNVTGLPFHHSNIILPMPDDNTKFILFHQTGNNNLNYGMASELYYSIIDMNQANGLGGIDSNFKNIVCLQDTLSQGISACKHANGRDWWIVSLKDSSNLIYKILLTPSGIASVTSQILSVPFAIYNATQAKFSPDGSKFVYSDIDDSSGVTIHNVRLFDFDRCTGLFTNPSYINVNDGNAGFGLEFSPNSQFLYASSFWHIFQINTQLSTVDTVATFDGFASPNPPLYTFFWLMYLGSDSKIYISTGNGTLILHTINYPDSAGIACDVQQHNITLPCYTARANVNHPNYYLGCDTTSGCPCLNTSLNEIEKHNFNFSLSPNPSNGNVKLMYILPQNKIGTFQIFDVTGKKVFESTLPQWSTLQNFNVQNLENGIYQCIIRSNNFQASKKLVVIHE